MANPKHVLDIRNSLVISDLEFQSHEFKDQFHKIFQDHEPFDKLFATLTARAFDSFIEFYGNPRNGELDFIMLRLKNKVVIRIFEKTLKETPYTEISFDVLMDAMDLFDGAIYQINKEFSSKLKSFMDQTGIGDLNIAEEYYAPIRTEFMNLIQRWKSENESYRSQSQASFNDDRLEWKGSTTQFIELFMVLAKKGYFDIPDENETEMLRRLQRSFIVRKKDQTEMSSSELKNRSAQGRNDMLALKFENIPDPKKR